MHRFDEADRTPPAYPVAAVDRTLQLLQLLGEIPELRLADVRERLGVGQSTAHRLVAMLVYRGFAVQDPVSRAYRAGPELLAAGSAAGRGATLRDAAAPALLTLARTCAETVHLGVLEPAGVRYLVGIESERALRVADRTGGTRPAHATSMGKSMLATLTDDEVRALCGRHRLSSPTDRTITDVDALLAELDATRRRGYARNSAEMEPGVSSVAIALPRTVPGPPAALSVAAPEVRWTGHAEQQAVRALRAAAATIVERSSVQNN
ncbi:IclR family transcriptional regulator [Pseudonocardia sp. HH130630-07]|uniref:IclR family transcriptional regulator n=1 Tax=Pseudonocardia sp. HH130630-07 TaxID=1690815 RepID=UPI0008153B5B|nr:IclR family transcriptional regulator [Pseudonocardia sp. HH130630-07]ANY08833.1 hypothetical protein AFB00_24100 [Pseudonocardia sp. HH130630-07]